MTARRAGSPGVREWVAKALVNKGVTLGQLDRSQEEIEAYDQVVARFGQDESPGVREAVGRALSLRDVLGGAAEDSE